jgi:uroporphyrinogen-III synthase
MARIAVTRPAGLERELAQRLESLGHDVVICPLLELEPLGDEPIDASAYDWLVVTSRTGAAEVARRLARPARRLAAIGPGTASELAAHGLPADLVASVSTQEGLLGAMPRPPGRVLVAAAESARRLLVDELGADFLALYRTHALRPEVPDVDLVLLASASAARALAAIRRDFPVVSIGPQTSSAAREAGLVVVAEAGRSDLDGLVAAVEAAAR